MLSRSSDRTGVLILRLWIEGSVTEGLRARITHSLDSAERAPMTTLAADPEDIYALVRTWVESFVDQGTQVVTLA
jgi:hypothetical protein